MQGLGRNTRERRKGKVRLWASVRAELRAMAAIAGLLACVVVLTLALLGLLSYKVFCRKGGLRGRRRDLTSHASIELTPQGALAYI